VIERTQKYLALDLELNQPSGKIIQVGVAIAKADDRFENYFTKKWYINPNEPIDQFITDLTGITNSDIGANCVSYETVARELAELIKEHNCFVNPVTWGGGDSVELLAEFSKQCVDFPCFGRRWIDVKTWYTLLMFARGKKPSGGLSSAMGVFKLQFKGTAHRADVDAANTLAFFFTLLERQRKIERLLEDAKSI
jgi:inhibitor of KinA sporulation pathway (predicted exonuclease)